MDSANTKNQLREKVKKKLRRRIRQRLSEQKFERDLELLVGIQSARVRKVHVDGLCKTQDWLVEKTISELLQVDTFGKYILDFSATNVVLIDFLLSGDVLLQTKRTQLELCQLGCFSNVNALIDQNKDNPQDIDVFFTVEELPLSGYKYSLETGDDEEHLKFGLSMPNLRGAGDKIESQFKIGTNGSQSWNLNYCWPLRSSSLFWNQFTEGCRSNLSASVYGYSRFISWAGLKSTSPVGLNLTAEISPKPWIVQLLQWDCSWRYLRPIDNHSASFATRSYSGHSLKSSLLNQVTINTLDDKVLPTKGTVFENHLKSFISFFLFAKVRLYTEKTRHFARF